MTNTQRKIYIAVNVFMYAVVIAILPTACDREYKHEHPTADTYISPADQLIIDMRDKDYE